MTNTSVKNLELPKITKNAVLKFKSILEQEKENSFVRILIDSGGCSGFSYNFIVDNKENSDKDIPIIEIDGKKVLIIDKISLNFIKNSSIDWIETLTQAQFSIDNPIAKSKCGCGSSFSI